MFDRNDLIKINEFLDENNFVTTIADIGFNIRSILKSFTPSQLTGIGIDLLTLVSIKKKALQPIADVASLGYDGYMLAYDLKNNPNDDKKILSDQLKLQKDGMNVIIDLIDITPQGMIIELALLSTTGKSLSSTIFDFAEGLGIYVEIDALSTKSNNSEGDDNESYLYTLTLEYFKRLTPEKYWEQSHNPLENWPDIDPVVLNLSKDVITNSIYTSTAHFDYDGDGFAEKTFCRKDGVDRQKSRLTSNGSQRKWYNRRWQ